MTKTEYVIQYQVDRFGGIEWTEAFDTYVSVEAAKADFDRYDHGLTPERPRIVRRETTVTDTIVA